MDDAIGAATVAALKSAARSRLEAPIDLESPTAETAGKPANAVDIEKSISAPAIVAAAGPAGSEKPDKSVASPVAGATDKSKDTEEFATIDLESPSADAAGESLVEKRLEKSVALVALERSAERAEKSLASSRSATAGKIADVEQLAQSLAPFVDLEIIDVDNPSSERAASSSNSQACMQQERLGRLAASVALLRPKLKLQNAPLAPCGGVVGPIATTRLAPDVARPRAAELRGLAA